MNTATDMLQRLSVEDRAYSIAAGTSTCYGGISRPDRNMVTHTETSTGNRTENETEETNHSSKATNLRAIDPVSVHLVKKTYGQIDMYRTSKSM